MLLKEWIKTDVLRIERMIYGGKSKQADFVVAGKNNPAVQE